MTVGGVTTRMLYEGDDVVVEWVDETGDGLPNRRRHYWLLPAIDE